ncbi:hypothetical protein ERHA55_10970 [Erwinia rhapontici]|nr:hypothetical protein ERHA55_10970 [Erwinia rhapontici]
MKMINVVCVAAAALLMTACAQKKETVYYWGITSPHFIAITNVTNHLNNRLNR